MVKETSEVANYFCPFKYANNAPDFGCEAHNCMAWRWYDLNEIPEDAKHKRRGYCGLAGPIRIAK